MKKNNFRHIPLLFLFFPTVLAACTLFLFFQLQLQNSFEQQLQLHARHLLLQISTIAREPMQQDNRPYLKRSLWAFAQNNAPTVENIAIFDAEGQFTVSLNNEQPLARLPSDFTVKTTLTKKAGRYYAWASINLDPLDVSDVESTMVQGYILLIFNAQSISVDYKRNIVVLGAVILLSLILGMLLWRYRHIHFSRQLLQVIESLNNLSKGYKHVKLPNAAGYAELNILQQQINSLVGFYEKRLTMKQFEVTALEQTLNQANHKTLQSAKQLKEAVAELKQINLHSPSMAGDMFCAIHQRMQRYLTNLEKMIGNTPSTAPQEVSTSVEIQRVINRLSQMLSELKVICDVTGDGVRAHLEYLTIDQLITTVTSEIKDELQQKSLELIVSRPLHPIEVQIDVGQILHLLTLLLRYTVQVTEGEYIKLTIDVMSIEADESGNDQLLFCKILGIDQGLKAHQYALLKADQIDSRLAEDDWIEQGLHLMVIKKTVESLAGQFKVKSLRTRGTQLGFCIPCQANYGVEPDLTHCANVKIVLLDWLVQSAEAINEQLLDLGSQVTLCRDQSQFLAAISSSEYDCAIISQPVMVALEVPFKSLIHHLLTSSVLSRCVLLTNGNDLQLSLPQSWKIVEKPFVINQFLDYLSSTRETLTIADKAPPAELEDNTINILAVDDNETNLKLLSVVLRPYPVKLITAVSGKAAINQCRQRSFDIILMDKEMPEMSGVEASTHIRQLVNHQDTPIIMFSAHFNEPEKAQILALNINDCMEKPLNQEKFYQLMEAWCPRRWQHINHSKITE